MTIKDETMGFLEARVHNFYYGQITKERLIEDLRLVRKQKSAQLREIKKQFNYFIKATSPRLCKKCGSTYDSIESKCKKCLKKTV